VKGVYDPQNSKEILDRLNELFVKYSGVIFVYNNQGYAIWREEGNGFFIFNSEDTNRDGKLVLKTQGACCAIRSTSVQIIVDQLVSNFRVNKQVYEIYSFRVEGVVTIEDELAKIAPKIDFGVKKTPDAKTGTETLIEIQNLEEGQEATAPADKPEKPAENAKAGIDSIIFHHQAEQTFGDHFQSSALRDHSYLTCEIHLTSADSCEAPFMSSAAVVMLRICKSSLWTSSTIGKIFQIGHSLFVENVESVHMRREMERVERAKLLESLAPDEVTSQASQESSKELTVAEIRERRKQKMKKLHFKEPTMKQEISITDIRPVVTIGKLKLVLSVESMIIGKVLSRNSNELSLQAGIDNLFRHYDYGLIFGHDIVAVWREQSHFFMFDPNQCDQFRRAADDDEGIFNSCLSCFKNTADLARLYIDNLPKDKRNSIFKIYKIETHDFVEKSNDWQQFKGIGHNKWIMSGHISEVSEEFSASNRNNQSTCMALAALAKTRELGVMSWNSSVVDEVVRLGDEFYSGCVLKLKEQGNFSNASLKLSETLKELKLERIVVDFYCEENVVNGFMDSFSLYDGLKEFFANDDLAVVTALGVSVAVFRYQDAFYIFDSQPRNEVGRNFKTVGEFEKLI
jgi:hypothetical protein